MFGCTFKAGMTLMTGPKLVKTIQIWIDFEKKLQNWRKKIFARFLGVFGKEGDLVKIWPKSLNWIYFYKNGAGKPNYG